jgi:hypothetical protein
MGVVALIGAVFAIAIVLWVGRSARENMKEVAEAEQVRILAVATTLAPWIDGSVHEGLVRQHPTMDALSSWEEAPEEARALHHALVEAAERNGLETPIFTLRIRPTHRSEVYGDPHVFHPDSMEFVLTSSESPYWLHTYAYKPDMAPTLLDGEARALDIYVDEHGEWISAYAPIRDRDGRVVGLLEVDAPLSSLLAEVRRKTNNQILLALVAFVLMMVAVAAPPRSRPRECGRWSSSPRPWRAPDARSAPTSSPSESTSEHSRRPWIPLSRQHTQSPPSSPT